MGQIIINGSWIDASDGMTLFGHSRWEDKAFVYRERKELRRMFEVKCPPRLTLNSDINTLRALLGLQSRESIIDRAVYGYISLQRDGEALKAEDLVGQALADLRRLEAQD